MIGGVIVLNDVHNLVRHNAEILYRHPFEHAHAVRPRMLALMIGQLERGFVEERLVRHNPSLERFLAEPIQAPAHGLIHIPEGVAGLLINNQCEHVVVVGIGRHAH